MLFTVIAHNFYLIYSLSNSIANFRQSNGFSKQISSGSANDIVENGFYLVSNAVIDLPSTNWYYMFVISESANWCTQRVFPNTNTSSILLSSAGGYVRYKIGTSWTEWQKLATDSQIQKFTNGGNTAINNFNCNTAEAGEYWLGTGIVNGPTGIDWAHLSCRTDSSGFKYQLFYRSGGSNMYYRAYNGTIWSDWGRVILDIDNNRLIYKWSQAWGTTLTFTLPQLGEMILFSSAGSWQIWISGSMSNPSISTPIRLGGTNGDPVITKNGLSITITMPATSTIIAVLFVL